MLELGVLEKFSFNSKIEKQLDSTSNGCSPMMDEINLDFVSKPKQLFEFTVEW